MDEWVTLYEGDAATVLATLPSGCVQTCVTSPPYWGLRDYGVQGQLGLEATPEEYVARLVAVFREVRRVLRDDGTAWCNLGDGYNANQGAGFDTNQDGGERKRRAASPRLPRPSGLKPKDLVGIPWRVAFALQADGWYLRADIIWAKLNPMPESVTDRPTKAHEYVFLLSKRERYFWDQEAVRERAIGENHHDLTGGRYTPPGQAPHTGSRNGDTPAGRNLRTVWTIATAPYPDAHFATFPPDLVVPCVKAGSRPGDTVLDPFCGSGTALWVAREHGRRAIGIELKPEYLELARRRLRQAVLAL